MSFAVIQTGGKQYKVSASEILKVERLNNQEGKTVEFKNVLFLNDDKTTEIGNPNIQGAKVEATILKNTKNKTILVFKKRRRKNSRKKYGHRQLISLVKITKIFSKNGKLIAQAETKKESAPGKNKISKDETLRKVKAEETRKLQVKAAKKYDEQEKKRLELAQENYLHAIALGSTQSMYTLASLYLQGHYGQNNEQAAMTLLQQAAALDHVESILYLGQLYNSGKGPIKQDITKANKYFIQAAALEDESAVIMYGRFLISRRDQNLEYGDIKKWLKSHTSNGSAEAMVIMGNLYATGTTVPASNSSAVRWYKKAVKQDIQNSDIVNEVAWTLTVSNIQGLKRPKYAKKIMDRLMKSSDRARNQPEYLDTWAATHAASGDFDQALVLQKEAISVATQERTEVIGILREHLELFRNGRTVTEKAP